MSEITAVQQQRLDLLELLQFDTAALTDARQFVKDDPYLYLVFTKHFARVVTESGMVARTTKAIQLSKESLAALEDKAP